MAALSPAGDLGPKTPKAPLPRRPFPTKKGPTNAVIRDEDTGPSVASLPPVQVVDTAVQGRNPSR